MKYIVIGKRIKVNFQDIKNFTTKRITHKQGAGRTSAYHEIKITLNDREVITFKEDQYTNFTEIKKAIYG